MVVDGFELSQSYNNKVSPRVQSRKKDVDQCSSGGISIKR